MLVLEVASHIVVLGSFLYNQALNLSVWQCQVVCEFDWEFDELEVCVMAFLHLCVQLHSLYA